MSSIWQGSILQNSISTEHFGRISTQNNIYKFSVGNVNNYGGFEVF
jgi:hypothetical protein